ncbi:hypothetical protein J7E78_25775 [Paenibacillus polymyxa]|uniref:hypothetical protein n=1 Tax=Paenibacillus polymyxa TaxID=1406 RepID=UPI001BEBE9CA|nr:hypothetical protein [Paenibacillus polymyxa]MBT2286933.1 hypothetical protein [Paenibacillus polymyxa]
MKNLMFIALCLTLSILFTACSGDDKLITNAVANSGEIEMKANNKEITPTVIMKNLKEPDYGDMDSFQSIMGNPDSNVPYVKIGETISVKFNDQESAPDSYELVDYVLSEEGTMKYKQSDVTKLNVDFDNETASFVLTENVLTYASSDSKDYEPGAVLRGMRLLCKWKDTTQEMAFVIRTDATQNEG